MLVDWPKGSELTLVSLLAKILGLLALADGPVQGIFSIVWPNIFTLAPYMLGWPVPLC